MHHLLSLKAVFILLFTRPKQPLTFCFLWSLTRLNLNLSWMRWRSLWWFRQANQVDLLSVFLRVDSTKGHTYFARRERQRMECSVKKTWTLRMLLPDPDSGSRRFLKSLFYRTHPYWITEAFDRWFGWGIQGDYWRDERVFWSLWCSSISHPTKQEGKGVRSHSFSSFIFLTHPWVALCLDMSQKGVLIHGNLVWNQ